MLNAKKFNDDFTFVDSNTIRPPIPFWTTVGVYRPAFVKLGGTGPVLYHVRWDGKYLHRYFR